MTEDHKDDFAYLLKPTGTCFDDALDYLAVMCRDQLGRQITPEMTEDWEMRLCHGILQRQDGTRYAHAWVEDEKRKLCFDFRMKRPGKTVIIEVNMETFYAAFDVEQVSSYTIVEALTLNHKYENYGPWELYYLKLCKNYVPGMEDWHLKEKKDA